MGCFSYICKECNEGVNDGERVKLFLLKDGKVIQEMEGEHDNYGSVYRNSLIGKKSIKWKIGWERVMDLCIKGQGHRNYNAGINKSLNESARKLNELDSQMGYKNDWNEEEWYEIPQPGNGIAAIHSACYNGIVPGSLSEDDPDQGSNPIKEIHK